MELRLLQNRCALWSILALVVALFGIVILKTDPIGNIVLNTIKMKEGSMVHEMWKQLPVDLKIKSYIFNITNAERFLNGLDSKLKVEEVGPYIFMESRGNNNITFNDNGTVTFVPNATLRCVVEQSVGDPKVDRIMVPNLPLLGVLSVLANESKWKQYAVSTLIWSMKIKPIINLTVNEYLWGYNDSFVRLLAGYFPAWVDFKIFGILDRVYGLKTSIVTMDLNEEKEKLYTLQLWDGIGGTKEWGYTDQNTSLHCNRLKGSYEGYLFPPNIDKGTDLYIFKKPFCRKLHLHYNTTVKMKSGLTGYLYKLPENTFSCSNPENECFCHGTDISRTEGLSDVSPCYYGLPLSISFPHFLGGDKLLFERIDGLSPDEKKHSTDIIVQPNLGVAMQLTTKTQVNIMVSNINFMRSAAKFSNLVVPILWMDAVIEELPWDIEFKILLAFKYLPIFQSVMSWILVLFGFIFFIYKAVSFLFRPINISFSKRRQSMNYIQVAMNETFKNNF